MAAVSEMPWEELLGNLRAFISRRVRTQAEVDDLVAFLETGLRDPDLERYVPVPLTEVCWINDDEPSRADLRPRYVCGDGVPAPLE